MHDAGYSQYRVDKWRGDEEEEREESALDEDALVAPPSQGEDSDDGMDAGDR